MTLTQLSYILAVAEHRNFGLAAKACFVTQPTLSMQIQKLEEFLGVELFDRSHQPVLPTQIGQVILAQARLAVDEAEKIKALASSDQHEIKGSLKLGVIPTLAPYVLPLFLQRLVESYPRLQVVVEELQTRQIVDRLKSRELDLGIAVTPLHNLALQHELVFYEPFMLYLSPNHPLLKRKTVSEKDLSASEVWLLNEGHCFRDQVMSLCRDARKTEPAALRFESGNLETLKKMVDRSSGYTLLPDLAARDIHIKSQRERIREFTLPVPTREVSVIYAKNFSRKALLAAVVAEIKNGLPSDLNLEKSEFRRVNMPRFD